MQFWMNAINHAKQSLTENREKLDKLAHALLEKETIYAEEVYQLLDITPRTFIALVKQQVKRREKPDLH